MIGVQKIHWGVVSGPVFVGEGKEQDWAEREAGLQCSLSEGLG